MSRQRREQNREERGRQPTGAGEGEGDSRPERGRERATAESGGERGEETGGWRRGAPHPSTSQMEDAWIDAETISDAQASEMVEYAETMSSFKKYDITVHYMSGSAPSDALNAQKHMGLLARCEWFKGDGCNCAFCKAARDDKLNSIITGSSVLDEQKAGPPPKEIGSKDFKQELFQQYPDVQYCLRFRCWVLKDDDELKIMYAVPSAASSIASGGSRKRTSSTIESPSRIKKSRVAAGSDHEMMMQIRQLVCPDLSKLKKQVVKLQNDLQETEEEAATADKRVGELESELAAAREEADKRANDFEEAVADAKSRLRKADERLETAVNDAREAAAAELADALATAKEEAAAELADALATVKEEAAAELADALATAKEKAAAELADALATAKEEAAAELADALATAAAAATADKRACEMETALATAAATAADDQLLSTKSKLEAANQKAETEAARANELEIELKRARELNTQATENVDQRLNAAKQLALEQEKMYNDLNKQYTKEKEAWQILKEDIKSRKAEDQRRAEELKKRQQQIIALANNLSYL